MAGSSVSVWPTPSGALLVPTPLQNLIGLECVAVMAAVVLLDRGLGITSINFNVKISPHPVLVTAQVGRSRNILGDILYQSFPDWAV